MITSTVHTKWAKSQKKEEGLDSFTCINNHIHAVSTINQERDLVGKEKNFTLTLNELQYLNKSLRENQYFAKIHNER